MEPIDVAWQLLKEVGIEGPVDPRRLGAGAYQEAPPIPEKDEQLEQAFREEDELRDLQSDESKPVPYSPKKRTRDSSGPLQGTSEESPYDSDSSEMDAAWERLQMRNQAPRL